MRPQLLFDQTDLKDHRMTEISQLPKNPYSLGLLAHYLSKHPPFDTFEFGPSISTLLHQINNGTHLIASRNDAIVGYIGWLNTTDEIAKDWLENNGNLSHDPSGTSIAVTIFAADRQEDIMRIMRAAKRAKPGRSVYWKRYFQDGRDPAPRRVTVEK